MSFTEKEDKVEKIFHLFRFLYKSLNYICIKYLISYISGIYGKETLNIVKSIKPRNEQVFDGLSNKNQQILAVIERLTT